jgi:hypothetical protein
MPRGREPKVDGAFREAKNRIVLDGDSEQLHRAYFYTGWNMAKKDSEKVASKKRKQNKNV